MNADLVINLPAGIPQQLLLLFHGIGGEPEDMLSLGQRLHAAFPHAAIASIAAPEACDLGTGLQWYSIKNISEENRQQRVSQAMQEFVATIRAWQQQTGVAPNATALVGFSQGATMALESTQQKEALSGRVVALSGRFIGQPQAPNPETTIHLIHGKQDQVIPYDHTVSAAEHLIAGGADVTADVIPFLGHQISDEIENLVIERLQRYLPTRIWREAMKSAPP